MYHHDLWEAFARKEIILHGSIFFNSILFSNFSFMSFDVGTDYTDSKKDDVQKLMLEFKYLFTLCVPTRLAKILKSLLQRHTY